MKKRTSKEQTTHDRKVRELARSFEKKDYSVKAATPRRPSPEPIGRSRRIPDLVVKKHGKTRIIEVETPTSLRKDKAQLQTFAKYAAKRKDVSFDIVVTTPRKKSTRFHKSTRKKISRVKSKSSRTRTQ